VYCNTVLCGKLQYTATEVLGCSEYSQKFVQNLVSSIYSYVAGIVIDMEHGQSSKTNLLQDLSTDEELWET
jgi:hypothetical protein